MRATAARQNQLAVAVRAHAPTKKSASLAKGRVIQAVWQKKKTFSVSLCVAFSLLYMSPDVAFLVKVFFFEVKKIICRQNKKKSVDRIKIFLVRNKNFLVDRFFFLDDDDELRKHYYLSISVAVIFF
jgi:hypothetical protein